MVPEARALLRTMNAEAATSPAKNRLTTKSNKIKIEHLHANGTKMMRQERLTRNKQPEGTFEIPTEIISPF